VAFAALLCSSLAPAADVKLPLLNVGDDWYTNVIITSVSATDIYFIHGKGLGNAKLKSLSPELQKKFNFDPVKAAEKEQQQAEANARYTLALMNAKPASQVPESRPEEPVPPEATPPAEGDQAGPRSFLDQPAPTLVIQKWLTEPPNMAGKFVMVDLWATWCAPCRKSIPQLNALYAEFKDRLVVIGLSDESEETVRSMTVPKIDYSVGIDRQHRFLSTVGVRAIPYAMLVDPKGIVRYEGHPALLDGQKLRAIIAGNSE
jgi:thiol-disulfide isomerase/thioredoxin